MDQQFNFATFSIKWVGGPRYIMITDPECVKHVLQTNFNNYPKGRQFHDILSDLLGDGIFTTDGDKWAVQRKLASHMFSHREFTTTIHGAFLEHGPLLASALLRAASTGAPLDLQKLFFAFTLDSIGKIAFGTTVGALGDAPVPFAQAFDEAQATVDLRFFTPLWHLGRPFLESERRLRRSIRVMDDFCRDLIAKRRREGDFMTHKDVLSRHLALAATGEGLTGDAVKDRATVAALHDDRFLRDVILNFLIAGRDTTAQALSWACVLLLQHPEVAAKVAEEAAALKVTGGDAETGHTVGSMPGGLPPFLPTHDAIERQLPYTRAVVLETLRLYPSVPKDTKEAVREDVLPDGTRVPAGAFVAYLPFAMGRSQALWGPDADEFKPQRFLEERDGAATPVRPSPYKFIAFNAGPRMCLGNNMALLEASFVLALLFRHFSIAAAPGQKEVVPMDSLTLPQKEGVRVIVTRRARA